MCVCVCVCVASQPPHDPPVSTESMGDKRAVRPLEGDGTLWASLGQPESWLPALRARPWSATGRPPTLASEFLPGVRENNSGKTRSFSSFRLWGPLGLFDGEFEKTIRQVRAQSSNHHESYSGGMG